MLRSFSLIETLASIILLSIILSNFSNLSTQTTSYINHNTIQTLQNEINSNNTNSFSNTKIDIDFTIQSDSILKYITGDTYNKYEYNSNVKLIYHDISSNETNLASKLFE